MTFLIFFLLVQGFLQEIYRLAPETQSETNCSGGLEQNEVLQPARGPPHPARAAVGEGISTLDFNEPSKELGLVEREKK